MNYIGSKKRLLDWLLGNPAVKAALAGPSPILFDAFTGTGAVTMHAKSLYPKLPVLATDQLYFCQQQVIAMAQGYKQGDGLQVVKCLRDCQFILDSKVCLEPGSNTKFYEEYARKRSYFSSVNAMKIGYADKWITSLGEADFSQSVLDGMRASLVAAADKVANTAAVYGAFLKDIKLTAQQPLQLVSLAQQSFPLPKVFTGSSFLDVVNLAEEQPMLELALSKAKTALVYLDPPYNTRSYSSNYHICETIGRSDLETFEPRGKTGLRPPLASPFTSQSGTLEAFKEMLDTAAALPLFYPNLERVVVALSYSSEGTLEAHIISELLRARFQNVDLSSKVISRFKSNNEGDQPPTVLEYLFTAHT